MEFLQRNYSKLAHLIYNMLTLFLSSSVRASLRTFAHGRSLGHHTGRHSGLPQPGLLRPVEYFNISGIKFRSCA